MRSYPFNFDAHAAFCHTNDDEAGKAWNRRAVIDHLGQARTEVESPQFDLIYSTGTRRLQSARIALSSEASLIIEPTGPKFYMSGPGYTHPTWGHGRDHGDFETAYDAIDLASIDDTAPGKLHIQALARATLRTASGEH